MQRQEEIWRFLQSSLAPLKLIFGKDVVTAFLDNRFVDKILDVRVQLALNADIIKKLTDNLKIQYPALIEGVVPQKIPYGLLLDICKKVLERGNCMVYLPKIIEVAERVLREQQINSAEKIAEQVCFAIERPDNFWVMIKSS